MDPQIEEACVALEKFALAVEAALSSISSTLLQQVGWMAPALTRNEIVAVPRRLARRIRDANLVFDSEVDDVDEKGQADLIASIPVLLAALTGNLGHLVNGNVGQAGWAYFETFDQWERTLFPNGVWAEPDPETLPARLRRQLRVTKKALDTIVIDREALEEQLAEIKNGAQLIGDLPVDAEMIANARKDVAAAHQSAVEAASQSKAAAHDSAASADRMKALEADAKKVLEGIEAVYRATTSHALAEAFNSRGNALRVSVRWWVGLLIGALLAGGYLGYLRVQAISELTKDPSSQQFIALIWVQVALGTLSLAAPLWVAWLATRQISQRFRLAEDYSFKASLATAYEGYRREAARIDPDFEKDLFGSALRHLDQEPLRFMADADHGSPYAEFFSSPLFQDALKKVPALSEDIKDLVLKALRRVDRPSKFKPQDPPSGYRAGGDE
ncbi:hypothetical protein [Xanthomonas sacchari]|uniref:hypothetical protein n=1 Tax=Xanthomonas sacchari TaxID=56458 RepID=UPI00225E6FF1|nr:hypothetical protein [Xanthomonas sacchari]MCW0435151.1 hypothetical protein [Xanthomonas sacchari]